MCRRYRPAMLSVHVTREPMLVRKAQELRYRVFAGELGAALPGWGLDDDRYDAFCEHLVVCEGARVVGTYRILTPEAAHRAGGYYVEERFDIAQLEVLRERMIEVGRACVDPEFRAGVVMLLMWSALTRYLVESGNDFVIGSASLDLADGGHRAASIYRKVSATSLSPDDFRVQPRQPVPLARLRDTLPASPPSLLRGYINLGAWVCGEPAWDLEFSCADLPVLLPLSRMQGRYARHFLARAA
jgi:putative hemolysin